MSDFGLTHFIIIALHRWYRRRSRPHGMLDVENRGTRMVYNNSYRLVTCLTFLFFLAPSYVLYFKPGVFSGKSESVVFTIKIIWAGLMIVILLAPLEVFREFLVVNDDGLMRSNLFGTQTRISWHEIESVRISMHNSEVKFIAKGGLKLKASLCYNGWQDFLEISAKHLDPQLQSQLLLAVADARMSGKMRQSVSA
jgi:hypothetical protein